MDDLRAERDRLDQQVEALLLAVEDHRSAEAADLADFDRDLYAAADQVRKEREQ